MTFSIIPQQQTPKTDQIVDINSFIKDNKESMDEFLRFTTYQSNAVGLAANQCSLDGARYNKRLFALKNMETKEWSLIIDPVITEYYGLKEKKIEGCLTWIGSRILSDRYLKIKVSYYDPEGIFFENKEVVGFNAQIWQHEINHLNGVPEAIVPPNYYLQRKKIGNNEKCPCGSGIKHKFCCLKYRSNR